MRNTLPFTCLPLCLFMAQAQAEHQNSVFTLGTVDIQAAQSGPLDARDVYSSVDVIGADLLARQPTAYSWELFNRAPGVLLTEFNQGTTSGKISFRGFNGEGEVNAVKLLIDGIPSNSNDGNMPFMDMVFPLELERLEVVRGTSDARYGLNNIAGNVNMVTRTGGNYSTARVRYGSFGTRETQYVQGIETGNWTQNYLLAWQNSDGYRSHAQAERYSLAGKWFYSADDGTWKAGLIARHYQAQADEPGYLAHAIADAHPAGTNPWNDSDQGTRRMNQLSLHLDANLAEALSWASKAYLNTFDDQRWTRYWIASAQQERDADERQRGAMSSLTWRPELQPLHSFALESGIDCQHQANQSDRYRTLERTRSARTRGQRFSFDTYGAYVQAVIEPVESLKLVPAYRVDRIGGDFTNALTGAKADINDYGTIRQPKLSVVYSPWRQASLYANWGRTFQVGTGAAAYKVPPRSADLAPSINQGWETGVKFTPARWLDGRVAMWRQNASGEVSRRLNDPSGDSDNVGQTRRWGYDLQLNAHPDERWDLWLAYTWQYSKILEPSSSLPASKGKEIDHVPHHLYNAGAGYQLTPSLALNGWLNGQTAYYLERENTQGQYGGYVLLNVSAVWQASKALSLDLTLKNLADRRYAYVWFDPDGARAPLFSPGDGRAVYLGATLEL